MRTGEERVRALSGRAETLRRAARAERGARAQVEQRGGGRAPWQGVATPKDPPKPNEDADESGALYGEHVTLTGDFEPFDKGRLWEGIAERGGVVGKNVTKKTTILVIGAWRSTTSKQKRAEELIDKGQDIALWPAKRLYSELGLDEEPPF